MYDVRSTHGDNRLGGAHFDMQLMNHAVVHLQEDGLTLKSNMDLNLLLKACQKAKLELSTKFSAEIIIDWLSDGKYFVPITRLKFEELIKPYVSRTIQCVEYVLKDAKMVTQQIDEIVLVGGSTYIPAVRKALVNLFGKEPNTSIDPLNAGIERKKMKRIGL